MKQVKRVAGLMSGTSADGVDAAIVDISRRGAQHPADVKVIAFDTFPYRPELRRRIFALFQPETGRVDDICRTNFVLGEVFAEAVIKLAKKSGVALSSIDLIGSHGQTIYHIPRGRVRSTLQIGEPCIIAERTGITTVADFRPRDIAAGGEGAPLVPYADYVLFAHRRKTRAIQNIGGIANVTFLPACGEMKDVIAFDTGPGNMILDHLVCRLTKGRAKYDAGGRRAGRGKVHAALLAGLMKHKYLRRRPPKSTGREEFGTPLADRLLADGKKLGLNAADILSTATAFTAESIADAYRRFLPKSPDEVILCGGGARNGSLAKMLRQRLSPAKVLLTDDFGISADAKEAVSFAILAHATICGMAGNAPSATGAKCSVVLGKIVPST